MQTIPDSLQARESAETVEALFDRFYADRVIDLNEARQMKAAMRRSVIDTSRADVNRAIGVCQLRGGTGGPRFLRLMRELNDIDALDLNREPLDAA